MFVARVVLAVLHAGAAPGARTSNTTPPPWQWPWTDVITDALDRLYALPNPD
ncbi:hypothetical protein OG426_09475 [Streptomyces canus]|uniref:hypothetical protein n=1 Tax=Streptomyces canus TaxID=58343 RepID=UPI0022526E52|nr:hypothetical protein [Streptomyces canus]MCX4862232.1 hypothetical protein [Streptomyces canus]WSW32675.1 hypothetical protein OG426_09475 [Streptomyces canus]